MHARIVLVTAVVVPAVLLASALHSWMWFFGALIVEVILLCLFAAFGRSDKRDVTPHELAEELERHLVGNEGPYDWDATTSGELTDDKLNRLIPRLIEYDRLDTADKREQFREIIETLRRGNIPN